jgi:hypothetical protein
MVGLGSGIDFVDLNYVPPASVPSFIGSINQAVPPQVFGYLPEEIFEIHRMLFLTEAPIEIEWQMNPSVPNQLRSLEVRTKAEPPGEGSVDKP